MNKETALDTLAKNQASLAALDHAVSILYIDGETVAPRGSAEYRAKTLGELSRMTYELTTDPEAEKAIEFLNEIKDTLDPVMSRNVSELYRALDRTRKIPLSEVVDFNMLISSASSVWHEAKEKNDYPLFKPYLTKIFDSMKRQSEYINKDEDPYNYALDLFERGLTRQKCDAFFASLRKRLVPVIKKVTSAPQIDDAPILPLFSVEEQEKISALIMDMMNIDPAYCTLGQTEHPFTANVNKHDVRITTHYFAENFLSSLYSVIHEGGHALYELNVGDELVGTCLAGGVSMAIHESQSRFYENYIGRSRPFCDVLYDMLNSEFDNRLADISKNNFYRMINKSAPSLLRTDADELTYSMHIMIRYELEKKLFDGTIDTDSLPHEWNKLYEEYLGIEVPNDRMGVLQDSHWSNANIGYFPSYAIGSAYGAQYLDLMNKEFDVYSEVSRGDFTKINLWLCDKIWKHGKMFDPADLFRSVCGEFDPEVYCSYLEKKFCGIILC